MNRSIAALFSILITVPALGWGLVGHGIVSEGATLGSPSSMPRFFHESYPSLVRLGYEPDRWRGAGRSSDAFNAPNHYLDYEYVAHLELPRDRYRYIDLLYDSGTLKQFGIDNDAPGFLPWRIAELSEQLEREWSIWSSDSLTDEERKSVESSIIFLAGVLGHFVGDAANPHHATIHFNGWALAPVPDGYPTDCSTHWRFETFFVSQAVDRTDVFASIASPERHEDYFGRALALVKDSQSLVEEIYAIDATGGFDPENKSVEGYRFAVNRLAVGAAVLRDLWWSAYQNGTRDGSASATQTYLKFSLLRHPPARKAGLGRGLGLGRG